MGNIKKNQSGFGAVETLLILIILGVLGFTGYYLWHTKQDNHKSVATNTSTTSSTSNKSTDPYAGWKTYASKFGFSFKYPSTARVDDSTTGATAIDDTTGPNSVDVFVYADGSTEDNCPVTNPATFPDCLVKVEFTLHSDTSADGVIVNPATPQLKATAQLVIDSYQKKGA
ncbi:MAG TPA: hypothetical protein VLH84_05840 [Patescibacteria group bacterium]|nr:hypothetical protein [Patescibacteria group bacterium]